MRRFLRNSALFLRKGSIGAYTEDHRSCGQRSRLMVRECGLSEGQQRLSAIVVRFPPRTALRQVRFPAGRPMSGLGPRTNRRLDPLRPFDRPGTSVGMLKRIKSWAGSLKRDVVALWIAARSPRTPMAAKMVAGAVAAYALSPIDLIPDFIPIFGYLDDLVIVPLGIALAVRLIPPTLMAEFRAEAVAVAIVVLWLVVFVIAAVWGWRNFR